MELVSAVIITHNRCDLLKKAIGSVFKQTYKNMECIVVDDASSDGTDQAVRELQEQYEIEYIYISSQESKGANYARNLGWRKAKGSYVAFLDDDDEWFENKIEKQMALASSETPIVYCGRTIERNFSRRRSESQSRVFLCGDLHKEILIRSICVSSTILIEKEILQEIGGFDENINFWQDYELCMRAFQGHNVAVVKEDLVLYRENISDRARKTNNVVDWEKSVQYIQKKHAVLFGKLKNGELARQSFYICWDGIFRARNCKNFYYFLKYFYLIMRMKDTRRIFLGKVMNKIR